MSASFIPGTGSPASRAHPTGPSQPAGKLDGPRGEGTSDGPINVPLILWDEDVESVYSSVKVIYQNIERVASNDNLFYTCFAVNDVMEVEAMVDSGSMACTLSSVVVPCIQEARVLSSN